MTTPVPPSAAQAADYVAELPAAQAVYLGPGGTGGQVTKLPCILLGWSVRETSGAAVGHVYLITGGDAGGQVVGVADLAAGASDTHAIPPPGVFCPSGLYADAGATAISGVAWLVMLT